MADEASEHVERRTRSQVKRDMYGMALTEEEEEEEKSDDDDDDDEETETGSHTNNHINFLTCDETERNYYFVFRR